MRTPALVRSAAACAAVLVMASPPALAKQPPTASQALHRLFATDWDWRMADDPITASYTGDRRFNTRWRDLSPAAEARRDAHARDVLGQLARIPLARLSSADRLNAELFGREWRSWQAARPHGWRLVAVSHKSGLQTTDELLADLRFETAQDFRDWTARLRAFGVHTDQTIAVLREGQARGRVLPRVLLDRVPRQLDRHLVAEPERSPLYAPFLKLPAAIPAAEAIALRAAARSAIAEVVLPAFKRYDTYFRGSYLPAAPTATGVGAWPGGAKLYAQLAAQHTTTPMTPDAIHQLGLREVARIRSAMEGVKTQTGFTGDLPAFMTYLRTDAKFKARDGADLLARYRALTKRIDPQLVKVFGTFPRTPYGVEPIPAAQAPDTTTAYYMPPAADGSRAGTYYVNLFEPASRPTWEMAALSLHEAVPGHHFQIARAMEQPGLPTFRQLGGDATAFVEGWGLYAESLGDEMGIYDDPYAKFGQLTYEMWRAVRLVVDTGLHVKGWSRDRAIQFFLANTAKAELDVVNEIDRYLGDPGQALAYKIGELRFKTLRARATQQLGPRFDVRAFHDMLLAEGALPLDVLERRVDAWIAARKR